MNKPISSLDISEAIKIKIGKQLVFDVLPNYKHFEDQNLYPIKSTMNAILQGFAILEF